MGSVIYTHVNNDIICCGFIYFSLEVQLYIHDIVFHIILMAQCQ